MRERLPTVVCCLLAIIAGAQQASAETRSDEALTLDYAAPSECPAREAFIDRVRKRTPKGRAYRSDTGSMRVVVEGAEGDYRATLEVIDASGGTSKREVHGSTCPEVTEAMALVVALALTEPAASTEPPSAAPPSAIASFPEAQSAKPKAAPSPTPAPTPKKTNAPAPASEKPQARSKLPLALGITAATAGPGGIAPVLAWGGFAFVDAGPFHGPNGRLAVGALASPSVQKGSGTARFEWFGARLNGCANPVSTSQAVLSACAVIEGGFLSGHGGGDVVDPADAGGAWGAFGVLLRPRLAVGRVILEAEGALLVPVTDPRKYVFEHPNGGSTTVHEIEVVTWTAGISAAFQLTR